mmetsp:Transcript_17378/g.21243  ORF Transcript_17378/g.21243 Transcript_17378/m.21243 type:complete len:255 (+) Transcript_17378:198-962(+)
MSTFEDETNQWSSYEAKSKQEQAVAASTDGRSTAGSTSSRRSRQSRHSSRSRSAYDFDAGEGAGTAGTPKMVSVNTNEHRSCLHVFFNLYGTFAGITAILLALGQMIGFAIEDLPDDVNQASRYIISLYLIVLCVISLLTELEWFSLITNSKLLTNWVSRGFTYIFMAVLSIDQASINTTASETEMLFIQVVSYVFVGIGTLYILMGLFCFQIVLGRLRADYQERRYVYAPGPSTPMNNSSSDLEASLDDIQIT